MAITTAVTKSLGAGYVQVDSAEKNGYKRYYKVPEKYAGDFADKLKKQDKTLNIYSNLSFFSSIFAGVLGATLLTKKIEGVKKFYIQASAGIVAGALSSLGFSQYAGNEEKNLLQKYHAKEIFYKA